MSRVTTCNEMVFLGSQDEFSTETIVNSLHLTCGMLLPDSHLVRALSAWRLDTGKGQLCIGFCLEKFTLSTCLVVLIKTPAFLNVLETKKSQLSSFFCSRWSRLLWKVSWFQSPSRFQEWNSVVCASSLQTDGKGDRKMRSRCQGRRNEFFCFGRLWKLFRCEGVSCWKSKRCNGLQFWGRLPKRFFCIQGFAVIKWRSLNIFLTVTSFRLEKSFIKLVITLSLIQETL